MSHADVAAAGNVNVSETCPVAGSIRRSSVDVVPAQRFVPSVSTETMRGSVNAVLRLSEEGAGVGVVVGWLSGVSESPSRAAMTPATTSAAAAATLPTVSARRRVRRWVDRASES